MHQGSRSRRKQSAAPTARPSSPIAGNMKISSSGRLSAKSRLSRTFENRPPLSARGSRPFEPMADRTHNQVLDDGLDRSRDFFTAVPMTNLVDGFFHRAPRSKIRRDEAGIVQVIMTRNGSGECRTAMGSEGGELSFVATAAEPASLGGETIGHGDAVAVRMRDRQPAIVTIETFEAANLQQP